MRMNSASMLAAASMFAIAACAGAQSPPTPATSAAITPAQDVANTSDIAPDIVVTARRREERLQDVPVSIDAITPERLEKLNIRRFEDIQTIVPGLSLGTGGGGVANGGAANASLRGIAFNQIASGSNGTVEFYLNDTPITPGDLFTTIYDVGQIEVLRGPQGTLRGRASPSGSITVTTRRPDMRAIGGYANLTGTNIGEINANAALNLPIIPDMLSIRAAALVSHSDGDRVRSINSGVTPRNETTSERISLRFEPTNDLRFDGTFQRRRTNTRSFDQVESVRVIDPTAPASPTFIAPGDRRSVEDAPSIGRYNQDHVDLGAQWAVLGQRLNYAGAYNKTLQFTQGVTDQGDFFGPGSPAFLQGYGQLTETRIKQWSHELRLSSDARAFGFLDYTVGGFYRKLRSPTAVQQPTAVLIPAPIPGNPGRLVVTPIERPNSTREFSFFGNLTAHIGDRTEIAAGARRIDYKATAGVVVNGAPLAAAAQNDHFHATIYSASLKHEWSDNLMTYFSTGSSWRPGLNAVGDFSLAQTARERSFYQLGPERSKSYEVGFKASALRKRMTLDVSAFHQTFENYPFRSANGVYYVSTTLNTATTPPSLSQAVTRFNFLGAVPVTVNGVEVQWAFAPTRRFNVSASGAYAKSKISNGLIPCNDFFPADGAPDTSTQVPTVAQIRAATGGDNIAGCRVNYRASISPLWTGNLQSEYRMPLTAGMDGYVRGLLSYFGKSLNDPTNPVDDIKAYAQLSAFVGIRDPRGAWELTLYGKNLTKVERVLIRTQTALTTSYNVLAASNTGISTYRGISVTPPREFGVNLRYAFGSR